MTKDRKREDDTKTIISREQFFELNRQCAEQMCADGKLLEDALDVLVRADRYRWIHQATWFGEPVLNLPQDLFAVQDIVWRARPEFIIEVGVAWGGGMLFEAMLLEILGGKQVIGIDIFVPEDLCERLRKYDTLFRRMALIEGSSTSEETLSEVEKLLGGSKKALVILDSNHTHEHVLNELRAYARFVGKGQYLICGDTIIERMPAQAHGPRPWGPGNSPATAVKAFLKEDGRFVVDEDIDRRLLFSCHPGGYLRAVA